MEIFCLHVQEYILKEICINVMEITRVDQYTCLFIVMHSLCRKNGILRERTTKVKNAYGGVFKR